jgi:hypothetical protein
MLVCLSIIVSCCFIKDWNLKLRGFLVACRNGIATHVNVAEPAALEKMFNVLAGNEQVADSAFNAKLLSEITKAGFGKAQEVAKFPVMQSVALARDVRSIGDDEFDHRIQCEIGDRRGIVYLARPEAELAFVASTAGNIPDPKKRAGLDPLIDLVYRKTPDAGNGIYAAEN